MRMLAVETTQACSVALLDGEQVSYREDVSPRAATRQVLPMVESLLKEAGLAIDALDAVAFGRDRFSRLLIPWATYTDPEVAHVGLYEADLEVRGIPYTTFVKEFDDVDRAIVDGKTTGFVKIHVRKGKDEILGATIVGSGAGDLVSEVSVAIQGGMGLGRLANVIHPYPTMADAIRACGDQYNSTRLTPTVRMVLNRLLAFQR